MLFFVLLLITSANAYAPLHVPENAKVIPDKYFVKLKKPTMVSTMSEGHEAMHRERLESAANAMHADHVVWLQNELRQNHPNSRLDHKFDVSHAFHAYMGEFEQDLLHKIRQHSAVDWVEADVEVHAQGIQYQRRQLKEIVDQAVGDRQWGICRASSLKRMLPTTYDRCSYYFPTSAGKGVDVYVLDSGVNVNHVDFEGRARFGATFVPDEGPYDGTSHGTHVAGIVGGLQYGLAKRTNIISVKVLSSKGSGSTMLIMKAILWVAEQHERKRRAGQNPRSIVNMSLGGPRSAGLEETIKETTRKHNIHFVVAAGNEHSNACNYSPAASSTAITVGASDKNDQLAKFSNFGRCVDIFAPGTQILSDTNTGHAKFMQGTSQAAPIVAGIMALYLGEADYSPEALKRVILSTATTGILKGLPSQTPNRLLSSLPLLSNRPYGQI